MDLSEYETWARDQAGIVAPKVAVRCWEDASSSSSQRGLFALETIYPGERILLVPVRSLIGASYLQQLGSRLLEEDHATGMRMNSNDDLDVLCEKLVVARIEALRQKLLQHDSSLVREVAEAAGYEWRDDDAVAIYLASCRFLVTKFRTSRSLSKTRKPSDSDSPKADTYGVEADKTIESSKQQPDVAIAVAVPLRDETDAHEGSDAVQYSDEKQTGKPPVIERETSLVFPSFLPHVALLPDSFPTSPLSYTPEELSRIDGTNCAGYATRMLEQFESDHGRLAQVLRAESINQQGHSSPCLLCRRSQNDPEEISHDSSCFCRLDKILTFEDYKWALCIIYSRSTDFFNEQQRHSRVIAPFFDMMNHDFESDVTHSLDHQYGSLSVFNGTSRAIEAGEEVCLSYGNFSNEKLLLIYGFVVENNPYDAVSIYAPIDPSDPLYDAKIRLLQTKCGIGDSNEPHLLCASPRSSGLPSSLLSVLRLIGIQSSEEVLSLATNDEHEGGADMVGMISVENERSALLALQRALYAMARQLALNLISDEGLLQGATSSMEQSTDPIQREPTNLMNAKILCQSEYQILQYALAELHDRLSALDGDQGTRQ